MKAANFRSLQIMPDVHKVAQRTSESGEPLSGFAAQSVRRHMRQRRHQRRFIERGLASRDAALHGGEYYSANDALRDLDDILAQAEAKLT
ncbi:prevent-host-death protein [Massilia aquatica]|uniref:prevent-host-death protein n=1 Tax=Massilia aquatica TaxID=2609000 RepID=UPI001A7E5931|nr:prevent-host-death protein [Massilia aquatica]